jgi:hypothetical protein
VIATRNADGDVAHGSNLRRNRALLPAMAVRRSELNGNTPVEKVFLEAAAVALRIEDGMS